MNLCLMETLLKAKLFSQVIDTWFNGSAVLLVVSAWTFELQLFLIGLKTEQPCLLVVLPAVSDLARIPEYQGKQSPT